MKKESSRQAKAQLGAALRRADQTLARDRPSLRQRVAQVDDEMRRQGGDKDGRKKVR